eukprot:TRINITY_DN1273_c0_g1_i1.p1 TRINITY_DN1273_c0_g1~~TRINITY_DN1273_c0_g1_i1.p1  ORF type:complete len:729 (-),score=195.61 TRINITY_DN1273_c0_g1_i1:220-2406(-)
MGTCASADGQNGAMAEIERDAAIADEIGDLEADPAEIIDQRRQEIRKAFMEIISRPCSKPAFDPADPQAHTRIEEVEPDSGDEFEEKSAPPTPMMPKSAQPEPKKKSPARAVDSDDDLSVSLGEETDEDEESDEEGDDFVPPVPKDTQLEDIIEFCGGKEIWEDIDEMKEDETAATILGRAGEHDSCYPWAKAHFMSCCMETQNLGNTQDEAIEGESDEEVEDGGEPGDNAPLNNYIASIINLRAALSHLQRSNRRVRINLAKDVCELHFDQSGTGSKRIGIDLALATDKESAEAKLTKMTAAGMQSMLDRVEERINNELLPEYYAAYDTVGNKEALAYPEEVFLMETYYPPGEEAESDEDAQSQLDVIIHKAKDVLAMDSTFGGEGTSDCYVKATVGDETFITDVRKGTRNPLWDKALKFDVDPEERRTMSLILKMYDEDFGGDEFMGMVSIPLNDLIKDGPPVALWHKLLDEPKSREKPIDRGQLFVSLRFGEPTVGDAMNVEDNLSAVALAQVDAYTLTRIQLNFCATMIQALWRGVCARGGVGGLRAGKNAEQMAIEKRVIMIQRKWRDKRMWKIIMSFKKKMTAGGTFLKIGSNGKANKRQVHVPGNMSKIYWREPGKEDEGNFIETASVKSILVGRYTKTFQKYDANQEKDGLVIDERRQRAAFSLITADRTLDLECPGATKEDTEANKNAWIDLFQFLFRDQMQGAAFILLAKRKVQFKKK